VQQIKKEDKNTHTMQPNQI